MRNGDSGWSDGVVQQALFKFSLDHLPIMLSSMIVSLGPKPCKVFNVWRDDPELYSVVK